MQWLYRRLLGFILCNFFRYSGVRFMVASFAKRAGCLCGFLFFLIETQCVHAGMPALQDKAPDQVIVFDLPSTSLNEALIEFGIQAKVSVVVSAHYVRGRVSPEVIGGFTVVNALQHLLAGSGLVYELHANASLVIIKGAHVPSRDIHDQSGERAGELLGFEEVYVVSARHRKEELHDVPMSVVSYSGEELEERGTLDLVQLGNHTSNATFNIIRGTNAVLAAYIRGIGHANPIAGLETSVGTYIDDVYFNRPLGVLLDIYDAERVEILRGPQGTLYGRNTIGGAIKYVTNGLPRDASLSVKLTAGSYNQRDAIVLASTPLSDNFRIGGSLASFNRDGFGKNHTTNEEHYNKELFAYRFGMEFEPNDDVFIRASIDRANDDSLVRSGHRLSESDDLEVPSNVYDTLAGIRLSDHPINTNALTAEGQSLKIRWQLGENGVFESITAHREDWGQMPTDIDSFETRESELHPYFENEQSSQEMRFSYSINSVNVLVGLYYLDARAMNAIDYITDAGVVFFTFDDVDAQSWAGFSSLDWQLNDQLNMSVGARYTNEKREVTIIRETYLPTSSGVLMSPFFGGDAVALMLQPPVFDDAGNQVWPRFKGLRRDDSLTPRVSMSWKPNERIHFYSSYRTGFKGGGYAPKGVFTDARLRKGFQPEKVDSYEIGAKSQWLDRRLRLNVSLFKSNYRNVQVEAPLLLDFDGDGANDGTAIATTNAEKARILGGEIDVDFSMAPHWWSSLSIGVLNADFEEFLGDDGVDISDEREFVATPARTMSFQQFYRRPFLGGEITFSLSGTYQSDVTLFQAASELVDQPAYHIINTGVSWTSASEKYQLSLFGLNVTDERYRTSAYFESVDTEILASGDIASVFFGDPRTVMGSLKVSF